MIEAGNLDALVLDRLRVVDRLRASHRETAYRVYDPDRGGVFLLRHLAESEMEDAVRPDEFRQRFAAARDAAHPNLAATVEVLEINGRPAALQEWITGPPSTDWPPEAATPGVWVKLLADATAALDAAQAVGGDIRGKQSAALIVVTGKPTGKSWADRTFDLRVDDSADPLKELRRLVTLQRAYNHMNAGDLAVEKNDNQGALREYGAASRLVPDNAEMVYWHAVALVNMGRVDESLPLFKRVFAMDRN